MASALDKLNAYVTHESDEDATKFAALLAARDAEVLREAADVLTTLRDTTDVNVAEYPRYDGRCRSALNDGIARLRRLADEAGSGSQSIERRNP
jgi:hypothetical protein